MPQAPTQVAPAQALPPHPVLDRYYANATERRTYLTSIFDETAADYDKVERWLSLGSGSWYRRQALLRAGLKAGMSVADVAVGTGLVAREAVSIVTTGRTPGKVVGIDPSSGMLERARAALGIETIIATAESLPFPDASVDFVSMGYALRHMDDLVAAFREFRRVLRPNGSVCILEITRPRTWFGRAFLRAYLGTLSAVIGRVTRLSPRTPELWAYYWETIDRCVPPQKVLDALRTAGFTNPRRAVTMGIFSEYTATVP
jgi:demethylmenaquinone methyltransferase/2-methoxy-6-polyprenyl-1,4-benzoquinol methylase